MMEYEEICNILIIGDFTVEKFQFSTYSLTIFSILITLKQWALIITQRMKLLITKKNESKNGTPLDNNDSDLLQPHSSQILKEL